jgi:medium-chain acyl-[acyl-carrier-protein] hydrolase
VAKPVELLRRWRARSDARLRLIVLSHAGGSASSYVGWAAVLQPVCEFWSVQLPGREDRSSSPPARSVADVAEALADEIEQFVVSPFAIFGHSLGALIGYETSRLLTARRAEAPVRLFLSAYRAPHMPSRYSPMSILPQPEFVAAMQRLYGKFPEALLASPDFFERLMTVLRNDLKLMETHRAGPPSPLPIPLVLFGGVEDEAVLQDELEAWNVYAGAGMILKMFPGGHFYLNDQLNAVPSVVAYLLR